MPVEIYPVAAVREMDRCAIEDHGVAGYTLMTRAAQAAVTAATERFPDARRWQLLCGAGNNAGDAYVVARLAAAEGIAVSVIAVASPERLSGDAATAWGDFAAEGGVVMPWEGSFDAQADLVFDGLLGSGLERDVDGELAAAVSAINEHAAPCIALDIPTGLHGDTGRIMGCAVVANLTVSFVGLKAGCFLGDGLACCGDIVFAGLDIPDECRNSPLSVMRRISDSHLEHALLPRSRTAHKGDFGHVLVIGGGEGMPGAARLCGEAALRAGAGRVSIATHPAHAAVITATCPELMAHAIGDAEQIDSLLEQADVLAFGPGLGRSDWAEALYERVVAVDIPAVWDADALNLLVAAGGCSESRIITPHPGEAARLLGLSTQDIQADRHAALAELQSKYGGIAVLKGAGTLVSAQAGLPWLCTAGNPGMAAPGMGDVLTGVIAALRAQGLATGETAEEAAVSGVQAHALAGDAAAVQGERGLMASDLIPALRGILNS